LPTEVHRRLLHPRSSFLYWVADHKERLTQESREAGIKFSKWAAQQWERVEDKNQWENLAEADKQDYAFEKEEKRTSEVQAERESRQRWRPRSAFHFWKEEHKEEITAMAQAQYKSYDKWALIMWDCVEKYEDPTKWREMSAADEEGEVYELPLPPEKPHYVKTAFHRWVDDKRKDLVAKAHDLKLPYMKVASDEWNKLTKEEKQPWHQKTELDSRRYDKEWNVYWKKKHPTR